MTVRNAGAVHGESRPEEVARSSVVEIDHISYSVSEEDGAEYTTVGIVFPNGARLQYRECTDETVCADVISADDVELESISIGSGVNIFTALAGGIERYRRSSESRIWRELPYLAAALLDER